MATKKATKKKTAAKKTAMTEAKKKARKKLLSKITIKRSDIIKALETEPLEAGKWVQKADLRKVGDCPVCAVGATLRSVGLTNQQIENVANHCVVTPTGPAEFKERAEKLVEYGDYLSALSTYFEGLCWDPTTTRHYQVRDRDRDELIKFVRERFPTKFEFDPAQFNCI